MGSLRAFTAKIAAGGLLLFMAGCETTGFPLFHASAADSEDEVANVYVTAYPAVAWSDIAAKLEPKHNLTTEAARAAAAVSTQARVSQFLGLFAAGLGINYQNTIHSSAELSAPTSRVTTAAIPGVSAATNAGATAAGPAIPLQPNFATAFPAAATDAQTLFTAGTALYQHAAILDSQISKAIHPEGYRLHLLTFQINLQPKARSFPVDTYVDLHLMPAEWAEAKMTSPQKFSDFPPVIVDPLVISDFHENATVARSSETLRQAALGLSALVSRTGLEAGVSKASKDLDQVTGRVQNSLVTVGRVSANVLRVRIGAQNSAESEYAMVPRSFNVSVVVKTRWVGPEVVGTGKETHFSPPTGVTSLAAFASTDLQRVDGAPFKNRATRKREKLAARTLAAICDYQFYPVNSSQCRAGIRNSLEQEKYSCKREEREKWDFDPDKNPGAVNQVLDILSAANRQDYEYLNSCLSRADAEPHGLDTPVDFKTRVLLARLLPRLGQIQVDAGNAKLLIALKAWQTPKLPPTQLFPLRGDDDSVTATLQGGEFLTANGLAASLVGDDCMPMLATSVAVNRNAEVVATFPSPKHVGQYQEDLTPRTVVLTLKPHSAFGPTGLLPHCAPPHGPTPCRGLSAACNALEWRYSGKIVTKVEEKEEVQILAITHAILVPGEDGTAEVSIRVGELEGYTGAVRIRAKGADLRNHPAGFLVGQEGGVDVAQKSLARLLLGNLAPFTPVIITAETIDADPKRVKQVGTLKLTVAR